MGYAVCIAFALAFLGLALLADHPTVHKTAAALAIAASVVGILFALAVL